jgi:hypothetical protein
MAGRAAPQHVLEQLAGRGARQRVSGLEDARNLVARQLGAMNWRRFRSSNLPGLRVSTATTVCAPFGMRAADEATSCTSWWVRARLHFLGETFSPPVTIMP